MLAVWLDGALHFAAGETGSKAKNLARPTLRAAGTANRERPLRVDGQDRARAAIWPVEARCAMAPSSVAWPMRTRPSMARAVRDGALYGAGAPTAGPGVYEIDPTVAFGFGKDDTLGATRWRQWPAQAAGHRATDNGTERDSPFPADRAKLAAELSGG